MDHDSLRSDWPAERAMPPAPRGSNGPGYGSNTPR
jgi:hypothetical protein